MATVTHHTHETHDPLETSTRSAGTVTAAGGVLLTALALLNAAGADIGGSWFVLAAIAIAAWIPGLLVLRRQYADRGRPVRVGLLVAVVALAGFALAHVAEAVRSDSATPFFPLGQTIAALALVVAGTSVARAGGERGRWLLLLCGAFPILVMTPVFIVIGHGTAAAFVAIAGWGTCWVALGQSLRRAERLEKW